MRDFGGRGGGLKRRDDGRGARSGERRAAGDDQSIHECEMVIESAMRTRNGSVNDCAKSRFERRIFGKVACLERSRRIIGARPIKLDIGEGVASGPVLFECPDETGVIEPGEICIGVKAGDRHIPVVLVPEGGFSGPLFLPQFRELYAWATTDRSLKLQITAFTGSFRKSYDGQ